MENGLKLSETIKSDGYDGRCGMGIDFFLRNSLNAQLLI